MASKFEAKAYVTQKALLPALAKKYFAKNRYNKANEGPSNIWIPVSDISLLRYIPEEETIFAEDIEEAKQVLDKKHKTLAQSEFAGISLETIAVDKSWNLKTQDILGEDRWSFKETKEQEEIRKKALVQVGTEAIRTGEPGLSQYADPKALVKWLSLGNKLKVNNHRYHVFTSVFGEINTQGYTVTMIALNHEGIIVKDNELQYDLKAWKSRKAAIRRAELEASIPLSKRKKKPKDYRVKIYDANSLQSSMITFWMLPRFGKQKKKLAQKKKNDDYYSTRNDNFMYEFISYQRIPYHGPSTNSTSDYFRRVIKLLYIFRNFGIRKEYFDHPDTLTLYKEMDQDIMGTKYKMGEQEIEVKKKKKIKKSWHLSKTLIGYEGITFIRYYKMFIRKYLGLDK